MFRRLCRLAVITVVFAVAGTSAALAGDPSAGIADLVTRVLPSVVSIDARGEAPDPAEKQNQTISMSNPSSERLGSGFIVDSSGIIVTNKHVIDGAYQILVTLFDGSTVEAKIIGQTVGYDIAMIKIDVDMPLSVAQLGNSDDLRVGDEVIAVGNPLGFGGSVTAGIVSALHRNINLSAYDEYIQTDAAINHGNSGGPLFNYKGQAIGLNTAIYTLGSGSIGIGFAIPSNDIAFGLGQYRKYGTLRFGWLGIGAQQVTPEMADGFSLLKAHGVIVSSVTPGSPAATAGLQVGDIIQAFGDQRIDEVRQLNRGVAEVFDQTVPFQIWRKGKTQTIDVRILQSPQPQWINSMSPRRAAPHADMANQLGLKLVATTPEIRSQAKLGDEVSGIAIKEVVPESVAAAAGLKPGDVIVSLQYDVVGDPASFQKMVESELARGKRNVVLYVASGTDRHWVTVAVGM